MAQPPEFSHILFAPGDQPIETRLQRGKLFLQQLQQMPEQTPVNQRLQTASYDDQIAYTKRLIAKLEQEEAA